MFFKNTRKIGRFRRDEGNRRCYLCVRSNGSIGLRNLAYTGFYCYRRGYVSVIVPDYGFWVDFRSNKVKGQEKGGKKVKRRRVKGVPIQPSGRGISEK
jgi:hypothetical protein